MHDKQMAAPDNTAVRTALWRALHVQVDLPPHVFEDEIGSRSIAYLRVGSGMYVHGLLERLGIADAVRKLKSVRTRRAIGQISYRTHGDACIQGPQHGTGFLTRPMLQRP